MAVSALSIVEHFDVIEDINTSGGVLPNDEADDDAEAWGLIRLDLSSCTENRVSYHGDLLEFGSGEF